MKLLEQMLTHTKYSVNISSNNGSASHIFQSFKKNIKHNKIDVLKFPG